MANLTYSVIGILALIIHLIINKENFTTRFHDKKLGHYRRFLTAILLYYLTDSLWGVFDGFNMNTALCVDTYVYYAVMATAVVLWSDYVVFYLKKDSLFSKILKYSGRFFFIAEITALLVNLASPIFFRFDEAGNYQAGPVRYIALYIQTAMFALAAFYAFKEAFGSEGSQKIRNEAIGMFSMTMVAAIVVQILFPLLPVYSIGYMIGVCFLHVHVEEVETEEYIQNLKNKMTIISSMAGVYFCSYYADLRSGTFVEVENRIEENSSFIGKNGNIAEALDKLCTNLVKPQYEKEMREFVDLSTIDDRLTDKQYYISTQFESVHLGWAEGFFIAADRDENGKLLHIIWAIRTINDEKAKEEKLLYNSYVDELTGLYNRKMYAEDIGENKPLTQGDDFVLASMDVNGLKAVNDGIGHAAGDELIKGAAECMKKCMKKYGRIYRTGGDEFIALLKLSSEELENMKAEFAQATAEYQGVYITGVSVSCGFAVRSDNPDISFGEMEKIADKNMYTAKRIHYTANGIDRRAQQQNAYKALCAVYSKILKVCLSENKYHIISMSADEQSEDKGFSEGIFEWLEMFGRSGQVHPDDLENYLSKTDREYMCSYFSKGGRCLNITYRRKYGDVFKNAEMKMIPADDYSPENMNIFLYVENIED